MQRTRNQHVSHARFVVGGNSCAPLMIAFMSLSKNRITWFEGVDSQKVYEALYARHGIAGAQRRRRPLCIRIYNTIEEIDHTVTALSQMVKEA